MQRVYERLETWEEGVGDRFYAEVLSSVSLLEAFPLIGPVVHRDKVRRVLVYNRHYGLFYVAEDQGVVLHALLDLRQNPRNLTRRRREI